MTTRGLRHKLFKKMLVRLGRPGSRPPAETAAADSGSSFAQRMMEKMGWKEGLGLGKAHQGITAPLMAQKTDHRSGVIVNADPLQGPDGSGPPAGQRPRGVSIQGTPSKVVLLRNIVGPGTCSLTRLSRALLGSQACVALQSLSPAKSVLKALLWHCRCTAVDEHHQLVLTWSQCAASMALIRQ